MQRGGASIEDVLDSSPILESTPGASAEADDRTLSTAWHYGDPLVEQARLANGRLGAVDRWDRVAILISGTESRSWLNDLVSQKINAIELGQTASSLILDAQGRVLHVFEILAVANPQDPAQVDLLLDVPAAHAEELERYLSMMLFWAKVTVTRLDVKQIALIGTPAASLLPESFPDASGSLPADSSALAESPAPIQYLRCAALGDYPVVELWTTRDQIQDLWTWVTGQTIGAEPTGAMAAEALRISSRVPDLGLDLDEKTIPHEVPRFIGAAASAGATQREVAGDGPAPDAAVHLNKGCYRGQETVSRVQNIGKSPRVLVLLHLDGSANQLPEAGADITAGGRTIGRVGSSVHDADLGPIALGLIKRSVVEKLAGGGDVPPLLADGVDAAVDPDDVAAAVAVAHGERPGRAAINRLRG